MAFEFSPAYKVAVAIQVGGQSVEVGVVVAMQ
jgi:hypothetical protein